MEACEEKAPAIDGQLQLLLRGKRQQITAGGATMTLDEERDAAMRTRVIRRLCVAACLCFVFMVVEFVGGYFANSLAIMSDAAHLFADFCTFAVSIGASRLASLPGTRRHTYGLRRAESLMALFSMVGLALVCIYLAAKALERAWQFGFGTLDEVDGKLMAIVAGVGVVVNVIMALVLGGAHPELPGGGHDHSHGHGHGHGSDDCHEESSPDPSICSTSPETPLMLSYDHFSHDHDHDHADGRHNLCGESLPVAKPNKAGQGIPSASRKAEQNVNLQAAYLHTLGDLLQSIAVFVTGLIIWLVPSPHVRIIDPVVTLLFCIIIFFSTTGVIRASLAIILEEVPPDVDWERVHADIAAVDGVTRVHDLHIWSISHGVAALSVHCHAVYPERALIAILDIVRKNHNIDHPTVQIMRDTGQEHLTYHTQQCYQQEPPGDANAKEEGQIYEQVEGQIDDQLEVV